MRLVICDDEAAQVASLKAKVLQFFEQRAVCVQVQTFSSAEAFLFDYSENHNADIVLLDIEMGKMNGIELAHKLRENNDAAQIIFITGYPDYIAEGYDVSALHYLMKPVQTDKLFEVLERAVEAVALQPRFVLLYVGKEIVRVRERDIVYAEARGHYMEVHTVNGDYRVRMTIGELCEHLGEGFYKCGRSYIVGLSHIAGIAKSSVRLDDGAELPLAKGCYEPLGAAWIKYVRTM